MGKKENEAHEKKTKNKSRTRGKSKRVIRCDEQCNGSRRPAIADAKHTNNFFVLILMYSVQYGIEVWQLGLCV